MIFIFYQLFLLTLFLAMQKIKQQKFGVDFETEDIVKRRGRPSKLQIKSSLTSVAGTYVHLYIAFIGKSFCQLTLYLRFSGKEMTTTVAAAELNENDGKNKEVEVPVILGLGAKGIEGTMADNRYRISDEVSLKLIKDQKKNLNDSGGDNPMVSYLPTNFTPCLRKKEGAAKQ